MTLGTVTLTLDQLRVSPAAAPEDGDDQVADA